MGFETLGKVKIVGGPIEYYTSGTTTNLYVEKALGDGLDSITISNDDSSDALQFSYDGATLEGNLLAGESITANVKGKRSIYIKGTAGSGAYRIWGW